MINISAEEFNALYWERELTYGEIAQKYKCHITTIKSKAKKFGIRGRRQLENEIKMLRKQGELL